MYTYNVHELTVHLYVCTYTSALYMYLFASLSDPSYAFTLGYTCIYTITHI